MSLALISVFILIGRSVGQDFSGLTMLEPNQVLSMAASEPATVLYFGADDPLGIAGHYDGKPNASPLMDWSNFHSLLGGHTGLGSIQSPQGEQHADWSSVLDPFMKDILEMANAGLVQSLLPQEKKMPCEQDIKKLCQDFVFKSHLQCIGQNSEKVSEACKKDVRKSLPFNCAHEIKAGGCEGLEKPIVICLSEHHQTKPLSEKCKSTLDLTKAVIHKLNTLPVTVLDLAPLNDTHMAANQTTSEAHPSASWECPAGFESTGFTGLGAMVKPCCAATPEMTEPRPACASGGGQWSLVESQSGAHGGMQCCPHVGMLATESYSQHIPFPALAVVNATAVGDALAAQTSSNYVPIMLVLAFVSALMSQGLRLLSPKVAAALKSLFTRSVSAAQSGLKAKIGLPGRKVDGAVGVGAMAAMAEKIKRGTLPRVERKERASVYEDTEFDL